MGSFVVAFNAVMPVVLLVGFGCLTETTKLFQ